MDMLDFEKERSLICDSMKEARRNMRVRFEYATTDRLRTLVTLLFVGATVRYGDLGYVPYSARALFWFVESVTLVLSLCCFLLPISRDLRTTLGEMGYGPKGKGRGKGTR